MNSYIIQQIHHKSYSDSSCVIIIPVLKLIPEVTYFSWVWIIPDVSRTLWFIVWLCMWVPIVLCVTSGWEIPRTSKQLSRVRPIIIIIIMHTTYSNITVNWRHANG